MSSISHTAFISAAASGIGLAIAENLASQDFAIVICDRDEKALQATQEKHQDWQTYLCDIGNPDEVKNMFAKIQKDKDINVLINNAGIAGPTAMVEEVEESAWQECLNVSLNSHFYCAKSVIPSMKANKHGVIINITSTAGLYGFPNRSPYVAAKWAICGLTKTWAMELGAYNIRVNGIAPGSVEGERMKRVINAHAKLENRTEEDIRHEYCLGVSMQSFVEATEIADMVGFLCSDKARHISGQIISVDGNTETLHVRSAS